MKKKSRVFVNEVMIKVPGTRELKDLSSWREDDECNFSITKH